MFSQILVKVSCFFFFLSFLGARRNTGFTQGDQVRVHNKPELRLRSWWSWVASGSPQSTPPQQLQPTVGPLLSIITHLHTHPPTSVLHPQCHKTFTLQQRRQHHNHHHHCHLCRQPTTSCTSITKSTCTRPRHRATAHRNRTSGALEIGQRA